MSISIALRLYGADRSLTPSTNFDAVQPKLFRVARQDDHFDWHLLRHSNPCRRDVTPRVCRVERSLYSRAVAYSYEAVKIFMPANRAKPVYAPYIEHVPPDVTAGIFWMKNHDPEHWRDVQNVTHVLGKYIISDKPMTEEEWARERADVLDGMYEPRFGDGREEMHLKLGK
jgi:hypothetical protein